MSLLKQILSPFVEFENDPKKPPRPQSKEPVPDVTMEEVALHPFISGAVQPPGFQAPPGTTVKPEHRQYFEKLIDDANATDPFFKGTDYKEFIDSKSDIDNIADEETRYRTAFNVLKRTGLTKERLLSTASEYHNIVGRDLNAFQGAHSQKYQQEVRQREEMIQQKAVELQAMSEKINALKAEISQLSQQITAVKDKLGNTRNSFLMAGEQMQQEIQDEIEKIKRYF